jgi:radical SAM superfamily enzyme YgiQ (UPF0313 family)
MKALVIDALGAGKGNRLLTRDVIGCGPRWVCGVLERGEIDVRIMLCEEFLRSRPPSAPDLLLVSGMTMDIPAIRKVSRRCRKLGWESLRIAGGPACGAPGSVLKAGYDLAVVGEGERALEALLAGEEMHSIPGTAHVSGSGLVVNQPLPPMDQDSYNRYMPSTDRITDYGTYFASRVYVEVVRGCSNFGRTRIELSDGRRCTECPQGCYTEGCREGIPPGCGFCAVPGTFGTPRSREPALLVEEISRLVEIGVKRIVLSAPDFLDYFRGTSLTDPRTPRPNHRRIDEMLENVASVAAGRAYVTIENIKPSLFDEESARIISRHLPGSEVHIGCETGDPAHSRALGRPSSPPESLDAVRMAKRYGLRPYVYFIHGLPGQTPAIADRSARLIREMGPDVEKITVYRFKPLPGSAFAGEPQGPPSRRDPASHAISEAAREVNLNKKDAYIGKRIPGIVAERNFQRGGQVIVFPLEGGPIVTVPGSNRLIGKRVKVAPTRAISERLLAGKVVEVLG